MDLELQSDDVSSLAPQQAQNVMGANDEAPEASSSSAQVKSAPHSPIERTPASNSTSAPTQASHDDEDFHRHWIKLLLVALSQ